MHLRFVAGGERNQSPGGADRDRDFAEVGHAFLARNFEELASHRGSCCCLCRYPHQLGIAKEQTRTAVNQSQTAKKQRETAEKQAETARNKLRLDLFDRRFVVFSSHNEVVRYYCDQTENQPQSF
jgi:hypothetical protein